MSFGFVTRHGQSIDHQKWGQAKEHSIMWSISTNYELSKQQKHGKQRNNAVGIPAARMA